MYRLCLAALLGIALLLAGGASRPDEPQQVVARLAAIIVLAASLWPLEFDRVRRHWRWGVGLAAAIGLMLTQLVPLPPSVWAQLPGHSVYARIAEEADIVAWRPLSLTPDLTINALFALLPATAAGIACVFLDATGRRRLARWMVIAACLSGLLGFVHLTAGGDVLHLYRQSSMDSAVGLFANRNHQGVFLACALPLLGVWAGVVGQPRYANIGFAALAGLLTVGAIATGSRMALVLTAMGSLAGLACFRASGHSLRPVNVRSLLGGMGGLLFIGALLAVVATRSGLAERLLHPDATAPDRGELLAPLMRTAEVFMPWGSGFGSFDSVYRRFEPDALLSTIYMNHAHNELFEIAIEGGIPALLLVSAFLWWWIGAVRHNFQRRRPMGIAAVSVTFMLMCSSLVDYPLRTPLLGAVFAWACVEMMRFKAAADERKA